MPDYGLRDDDYMKVKPGDAGADAIGNTSGDPNGTG
jgi:hypothetical protein